MKKRNFLFTTVALSSIFMFSCEEDNNLDLLEEQENRYFNLYIAANYAEIEPTESGLYYIEYIEGQGASPDTGDYVLINYLAYTIPNEEIVDTYTEDWAKEYSIYNGNVMYGPYKYKHGSEIPGLQEGVSKMKEGGISRILFKSDLGYGSTGDGSRIGSHESVMYDIELIEVIGNAGIREKEDMMAYLDSIGVGNYVAIYDENEEVEMYYIPQTIGEGDPIVDEDLVEIFYTGQLLDGRVFDTNEDGTSPFDVTIGEEAVIAGWEIGLKYFNYGGAGQLLIPHQLAYGEEGSLVAGTNKYSIPPFEALLFDIRVEPKEVVEDAR